MDETHDDLWLWEHSQRVMDLTQLVARLPELDEDGADLVALQAAALFHDAGWALEHQQGRHERWQLLARPTSDIQHELGAGVLEEEVGHLLPASTCHLAADAIRRCNDRETTLLEARILAEAEALDEMGMTYVLRQYRLYQSEGRPLQQLVDSWRRQAEYGYWEVRLANSFHYDATRQLARQRLAAVDAFMNALATDLHGDDLARLLDQNGVARTKS